MRGSGGESHNLAGRGLLKVGVRRREGRPAGPWGRPVAMETAEAGRAVDPTSRVAPAALHVKPLCSECLSDLGWADRPWECGGERGSTLS